MPVVNHYYFQSNMLLRIFVIKFYYINSYLVSLLPDTSFKNWTSILIVLKKRSREFARK